MSADHKPLPVAGYTDQNAVNVELVNQNKLLEERVLRQLDRLGACRKRVSVSEDDNAFGTPEGSWSEPRCSGRWLAIARSHIEQGFMAMNRAVFRPGRVPLPEDKEGEA